MAIAAIGGNATYNSDTRSLSQSLAVNGQARFVSELTKAFKHVDRVRYTYDFGDSWQHVIALEAQEPGNASGTWCEVLDGAGACPPEDVGGVPGYLDFLQVIAQPDSEEGQEALAWAGGHFDPAQFDCRAATAAAQRICNNLWG
ncbi:plasmid pRiA4b ORF-3 family protein [Halopseudomonas yangmingensis]|uniref:PRiA4b ORF-3-like protein n=1 Tax=Halopseudomonas yangmingensis TaxID=1720063 RepID=A0A1I4RJE0_9GAMM|nr:plasmid pRiA4b ORF-3 family protein [Halopseudomonas yangmingensis]SFM52325.1 pRiA4b ORF-3-like protein [Halopseudomonas yangmingensis]